MSQVLGISPGTRVMGMAFAKNGMIYEWQLKSFKGKWSKTKLHHIKEIVNNSIADNNIGVIAIKFPHPSRSSNGVDALCAEILQLAQELKLAVFVYNHKDLRNKAFSPKFTTVREVQKLNEAAACALNCSCQ